MRSGRRAFLAGALATCAVRGAWAMGRTPLGGRVRLHVPWPTSTLDPHDLFDPLAALVAHAVADPLFAFDGQGNPYPALAAALPAREAGTTVVRLREGLRTVRGAPLDARDVLASIERARARGAGGALGDVPTPRSNPDPLALSFGSVDPGKLARALASPLVAILPRKFSAYAPDGTGAFRVEIGASGASLTRNLSAARGPAFLDAIDLAHAPDLATPLRAFEAEQDDVGWLGLGIHADRPGAVRFDLGRAAWVVLGARSSPPGVAQRLCDAVADRVAQLGLGPLPRASGDPAWPGSPTELVVDEGSPHLVEIARTIAPVLSRPGHELIVSATSRADVARRRGDALTLEIVRAVAPGGLGALVSLATAEDPARARELARTSRVAAGTPARTLTSGLRVGVLGELRVAGGVVRDVALAGRDGEGWDLGASFRRSSKRPA